MDLKHNDAFMLMTYSCNKCRRVEMIWNGRNAVSPFSVACPCGHSMNHINWNSDVRVINYKPPSGSRYFADFTPERAKETAVKVIARYKGAAFEVKEGSPEYDELYTSLVHDYLHGDCSMDLLTVEILKEEE